MNEAVHYAHNIGEALAFICVAGVLTAIMRWKYAAKKETLVAFIFIMCGLLLREWTTWAYGVLGWSSSRPVMYSAISRLLILLGAAVFINFAFRERYGLLKGVLIAGVIFSMAFCFSLMIPNEYP